MRTAAFITLLASVVSATPFGQRSQVLARASETCPVVFDGRVPANASLTDFDTANGGGWNPYNPGFVKGNNISWSEILQLPKTKTKSRFDTEAGTIPLEVTISDNSIFMKQLGFRRAGLQFNKDSNEGSPGSKGVKTLHFSIMQDDKRPLNLSHEYLVSIPGIIIDVVDANKDRMFGTRRPISPATSSSSRLVNSSDRTALLLPGSFSTRTSSFSGRLLCSRRCGRTLPSLSTTRRSKSPTSNAARRA